MEQEIRKENLEKLLDLIDTICGNPNYSWFKEELLNRQGVSNRGFQNIFEKLDNIEKYLKLDGIQSIDYSEIKEDNVRSQLIADNIQMQKYRLGKIENQINFEEFCKYAHFQAEELVNYFFKKYFISLDSVKNAFEENKIIFDFSNINLIEEIGYYYKMIFLCNKIQCFVKENKFKDEIKFSTVFININKIRNEISHRSSLNIKLNDDQFLDSLCRKNIDISKKFSVYSGEDLKAYNLGKQIMFKRKTDFKEITKALYQFKTYIVYFINNYY